MIDGHFFCSIPRVVLFFLLRTPNNRPISRLIAAWCRLRSSSAFRLLCERNRIRGLIMSNGPFRHDRKRVEEEETDEERKRERRLRERERKGIPERSRETIRIYTVYLAGLTWMSIPPLRDLSSQLPYFLAAACQLSIEREKKRIANDSWASDLFVKGACNSLGAKSGLYFDKFALEFKTRTLASLRFHFRSFGDIRYSEFHGLFHYYA